ncbi:MAG: hypothetical protein WAZ68_06925 [Leptotrichiaceae bacterium]
MIVKKEMKKILLLISMTMFLTSCRTLLYMATDGEYGGRKPPEKESPAYMDYDSGSRKLKDYLDSILARKRETKVIMDGFEGKLPEGMIFRKGYPKQTRILGYKNVVYLFDEKEQYGFPLMIVNMPDKDMEEWINNDKDIFTNTLAEDGSYYLGMKENPDFFMSVRKIRNNYYAFNESIGIYYKRTGNFIGSEYFFEEIVNGLCDCKYNRGVKKLESDVKEEPYKYEKK